MSKSIQDVCHIFWELENKYNLLDIELHSVKSWQLIRFKLYRKIVEIIQIQEKAHTVLTKPQKIMMLLGYIKNSIFKNPFFVSQSDVLVVSHPRVKKVDGKYIDIYTKYFIQELLDANVKFVELESPYLGKHLKNNQPYVIYSDFIILLKNFLKFFIPFSLNHEQKKLITNINDFFSKKFAYSIDIKDTLIRESREFKVDYWLYKILLTRIKPKVLYVVVSYGFMPIIKAAKDLNIKVIELQHGTLSPYHLGYSFPNRKKELDYFPNEFLVWNDFWKNYMNFPILDNNIKIKSFTYMSIYLKKYANVVKKDQVVILSQGNIGNQLAKLLLEEIELFKDFKVIYKLHPGEYDRYNEYPALKSMISKYSNVELVEDVDLYHLLAESKYQIGVNSTALYEGLEFGCETILFNTVGVEYMDKFIEFNDLHLFNCLYMSKQLHSTLVG